MKIGIDLDEVISETMRKYLEFYNERFNKNIVFENLRYYNHWENESFGGTREEAIKNFDDFYNSSSFDEIELVEGAGEAIKRLFSRHELFIITSRPVRYKPKTERFVQRNFGGLGLSVFYSEDFHRGSLRKAEFCKKINVDLLIEDCMQYALECFHQGIDVFLFDKPWNQGIVNEVIRVYSWKEVEDKVNEKCRNRII